MEVYERLIKEAGGKIYSVNFSGGKIFEKLLEFIMLANWTAYEVAKARGVDPDDISFIEDFKKLIL